MASTLLNFLKFMKWTNGAIKQKENVARFQKENVANPSLPNVKIGTLTNEMDMRWRFSYIVYIVRVLESFQGYKRNY